MTLAFSLFALGFLLFFIVQDLNFDNLAIHIDTLSIGLVLLQGHSLNTRLKFYEN